MEMLTGVGSLPDEELHAVMVSINPNRTISFSGRIDISFSRAVNVLSEVSRF
jgi:hypothetical protein